MPSDLHIALKEILKKFGIKDNKVIGKWLLVGHLVNLYNQYHKQELDKAYSDGVKSVKLEKKTNKYFPKLDPFKIGYNQAVDDLEKLKERK